MRKYITIIALLALASVLAGCVPQLPPSAIAPICKALVGPLRYNTYNKMSQRYAGYLLSLDLKQRNQIGRSLGCPLYKSGR
jgi:hypothetical protein